MHVCANSSAPTSHPFTSWRPEWSWTELVSPAEAVCRQIAAPFGEVPEVRQPVIPGFPIVLRTGRRS
jgi:hypothetical protein